MRIRVLTVPDCPNGPVVRERITTALAGRDVEAELIEISEQAEAERAGMTGSPTVLFDGIDPFVQAGAVASVSCRIYRDADSNADGAPSVDDLRRALAAAGLPEVADDDSCADVLDLVGRDGRGRVAPVEGGLRAVHQAVLRHFAATGSAPELAELEPVAAAIGQTASKVLAELAREDFLALDRYGRIRAAYPFSAVPTAHRVAIAGGTQVWSMCAIDALGISAMLETDTVISSADPVTGEKVTVTSEDGKTIWAPQIGGGVRRAPRLLGARRRGVLRHPELLHQHVLRPGVDRAASGRGRADRRPGPRRRDRQDHLRATADRQLTGRAGPSGASWLHRAPTQDIPHGRDGKRFCGTSRRSERGPGRVAGRPRVSRRTMMPIIAQRIMVSERAGLVS